MVKKIMVLALFIMVVAGILAWCPWITKEYAEEKAIGSFRELQKSIFANCSLECKECGTESKKAPFGYEVKLKYLCVIQGKKDTLWNAEKFISALGQIR